MTSLEVFWTYHQYANKHPMKSMCEQALRRGRLMHRGRRAMTLVEIMMGTALLAMLGTTLVSLFVQNFRMSKLQAFRSQAVTTSLTILEQLRFMQYPQVETVYLAGTSGAFSVKVADPTQTTDYVTISVPVNVRDGVLQSSTWTTVN